MGALVESILDVSPPLPSFEVTGLTREVEDDSSDFVMTGLDVRESIDLVGPC